MSVHRLLILATLVMLTALAACREITAPGALGGSTTPEIVVLDVDGSVVSGRRVWLSNRGHVPPSEVVDWDEVTDEDGRVRVDLTPGTYVATFPASRAAYSEWVDPWFELVPGTTVVRAGENDVPIALDLPEAVNTSYGTLMLYGRIALETGELSFSTRLNLEENRQVSGPWLPDATYDVLLNQFDLQVALAEDVRVTPVDTLRFGWEPTVFQVRIMLGGQPLLYPGFSIKSRSPGADITMTSLSEGPVSSFYANEGVGELIVQSRNSLPFMDYVTPYEFRTDQVPEIELGDHRVEFLVETTNGTRAFNGSLQVVDAVRGGNRSRSFVDGRTEFYLRPSQYRLVGRVDGFEPAAIVADIASDSTFTFVLEPEEP